MEQTFLYEVRPRKIITGIHGVAYIRAPRSIYLTKEEVLVCLQCGSVYRRFANLDKLERVTVTNVDRLHNEDFIPEDQWTGKVEEPKKVEEPLKEEEPVDETPAEETSEEEVDEAVEDTLEEAEEAPAEEDEAEETAEEEESDDSEEAVEEVEEAVNEVAPQQNNNIQFKSHHKKHKK